MILDLHAHTVRSHDGFTTARELVAACRLRGIDAIAITEHDRICAADPDLFARNGVELIPGCEFTDASGAHILGLFVTKGLPFGSSSEKILDHIHEQGGFAVMAHPWKPGSGFLATGGARRLAAQFDFVELINGGWLSRDHIADTLELAREFGLRLIASSDSHKANQVGLCCTRIQGAHGSGGAATALRQASQDDIEFLIDGDLLERYGRRVSSLQKTTTYQAVLPFIPKQVRRGIKLAYYSIGDQRYARSSNFKSFNCENLPW